MQKMVVVNVLCEFHSLREAGRARKSTINLSTFSYYYSTKDLNRLGRRGSVCALSPCMVLELFKDIERQLVSIAGIVVKDVRIALLPNYPPG
uniref:Uncharacterized protein n=1 Tax=Triticum urartu TaxID=4572 RepID=A0A8R7Q3D0_TRIUA